MCVYFVCMWQEQVTAGGVTDHVDDNEKFSCIRKFHAVTWDNTYVLFLLADCMHALHYGFHVCLMIIYPGITCEAHRFSQIIYLRCIFQCGITYNLHHLSLWDYMQSALCFIFGLQAIYIMFLWDYMHSASFFIVKLHVIFTSFHHGITFNLHYLSLWDYKNAFSSFIQLSAWFILLTYF